MSAKRVLIIDDDEFVLFLVKTFTQLLLPNHQIITAKNNTEALLELQQRRFDLVMIDYQSPQINGPDLTRAIWKIDPNIPIMLMTGNNAVTNLTPKRRRSHRTAL
jgi:two-component system chemotaxis response regulator CheY